MKAGTLIKLPDGRDGTVVYNSLDGVGIIWGHKTVDVDAIMNSCPIFSGDNEGNIPSPEALLRTPYEGQWCECVGDEFEVVSE
jgi:hypothetical protein